MTINLLAAVSVCDIVNTPSASGFALEKEVDSTPKAMSVHDVVVQMDTIHRGAMNDLMELGIVDFVQPPGFEVNLDSIIRPAHDYIRVCEKRDVKSLSRVRDVLPQVDVRWDVLIRRQLA